jgi:hypothetical protein
MAKNNNSGGMVGVGAGLAAVAAAGAAAYWLYGAKHSAQHRKMAKSWMLKARAEVLDAVEKLNEIDKAQYLALAQRALTTYGSQAGASAAEMSRMMKDFRSAWAHMQAAQKEGAKGAGRAKRTVKKAAKKARKTVSKK